MCWCVQVCASLSVEARANCKTATKLTFNSVKINWATFYFYFVAIGEIVNTDKKQLASLFNTALFCFGLFGAKNDPRAEFVEPGLSSSSGVTWNWFSAIVSTKRNLIWSQVLIQLGMINGLASGNRVVRFDIG